MKGFTDVDISLFQKCKEQLKQLFISDKHFNLNEIYKRDCYISNPKFDYFKIWIESFVNVKKEKVQIDNIVDISYDDIRGVFGQLFIEQYKFFRGSSFYMTLYSCIFLNNIELAQNLELKCVVLSFIYTAFHYHRYLIKINENHDESLKLLNIKRDMLIKYINRSNMPDDLKELVLEEVKLGDFLNQSNSNINELLFSRYPTSASEKYFDRSLGLDRISEYYFNNPCNLIIKDVCMDECIDFFGNVSNLLNMFMVEENKKLSVLELMNRVFELRYNNTIDVFEFPFTRICILKKLTILIKSEEFIDNQLNLIGVTAPANTSGISFFLERLFSLIIKSSKDFYTHFESILTEVKGFCNLSVSFVNKKDIFQSFNNFVAWNHLIQYQLILYYFNTCFVLNLYTSVDIDIVYYFIGKIYQTMYSIIDNFESALSSSFCSTYENVDNMYKGVGFNYIYNVLRIILSKSMGNKQFCSKRKIYDYLSRLFDDVFIDKQSYHDNYHEDESFFDILNGTLTKLSKLINSKPEFLKLRENISKCSNILLSDKDFSVKLDPPFYLHFQ